MWPALRNEIGWIVARTRRRLGSALALSLAFKAVGYIVLAPLGAAVLKFCLNLWGRASVGNFELVAFFTSPAGILALLAAGSLGLASLYLELGGLIRLLADDRLHWWHAFGNSARTLFPLVRLGLVQAAIFLGLAVPFLLLVALVYVRLWHGNDLNALIILKPPRFWWGAALAGAICAAYLVVAVPLFLRQLLAVPIVALEPVASMRTILRSSWQRTGGQWLRSLSALGAWFAVQTFVGGVVLAALTVLLQGLLRAGSASTASAIVATGAVLGIQAVFATLWGVVSNIALAAIVLSLYRQTAPRGVFSDSPHGADAGSARTGWALAGALLAIAVVATALSGWTLLNLTIHDDLEITAHRAGAAQAPENTVAALKRAVADGADWAEIDVQLTADNQLVVMHDIDLARVGGGSQRVDRATLAEIQSLDVGVLFGRTFAGERVPTLKEMLAAAQGKIRLNIELKPHGSDYPDLTRSVLAELRQANLLSSCRLCSQSYESLQLARQMAPDLPVGYIVATSVGDPTQLDVDFLMVGSNLATRSLVERARLRGIGVHAWTVNDPAQVAPLLDAGVANLITDDPALIREELDRIRRLTLPERLLLQAATALGRKR